MSESSAHNLSTSSTSQYSYSYAYSYPYSYPYYPISSQPTNGYTPNQHQPMYYYNHGYYYPSAYMPEYAYPSQASIPKYLHECHATDIPAQTEENERMKAAEQLHAISSSEDPHRVVKEEHESSSLSPIAQLADIASSQIVQADTTSRSQCSNASPSSDVSSKRKFSCEICGKVLQRKENLIGHLRIHSGDMPFECKSCGRKFRFRSGFKVHCRTCVAK